MPNSKEIFTPRLHLRCPVETDASAICAIVGDWEVARRLARMPHPYTPEHFRFFMEHIVPSEYVWAMIDRKNHELVGVIGLASHREIESAELGYYVARAHWGKGLATEAARAIVHTALKAGIYARLTSRYHDDNPASGRVLEKLGFKAVGHSTHACLAEGTDKATTEVEFVP